MGKHLIDSDVYIDFLQTGRFHGEIAQFYVEHTPNILFSSVVIAELLIGAISVVEQRNVEVLYLPFEKARRIVTPGHAHWKEMSNVLARIFRDQPSARSKLPSLVSDCLIAMSARAVGDTVYTRNRSDFELLQRFRNFSLVVLE
jgi:predicted nucleic acid-binding protein